MVATLNQVDTVFSTGLIKQGTMRGIPPFSTTMEALVGSAT